MPFYDVRFAKVLTRHEMIEAPSLEDAYTQAKQVRDFFNEDEYGIEDEGTEVELSDKQQPNNYEMIISLVRFFSYIFSPDPAIASLYDKFYLGGNRYLRVHQVTFRGEVRTDLIGITLDASTHQEWIVPRSDYAPYLDLIAEKVNGKLTAYTIVGIAS